VYVRARRLEEPRRLGRALHKRQRLGHAADASSSPAIAFAISPARCGRIGIIAGPRGDRTDGRNSASVAAGGSPRHPAASGGPRRALIAPAEGWRAGRRRQSNVGNAARVLRGVGENSEDQNSVSGSTDEAARNVPHRVPKSADAGTDHLQRRQSVLALGSFRPQSRRRPPSPTPASSPTASPNIMHDVAGLTIGSSMVRERQSLRVTSSLRPSALREPSSSQRVSPSP
jgi:hypothetical protein